MVDPIRAKRYKHILTQMYLEGIFQDEIFPENISNTVALWHRGEVSWEKTIQYLWHHRMEASVNVTLGGIYYSSLIQDQEKRSKTGLLPKDIFENLFEDISHTEKKEITNAARAAENYNGSDRILQNGELEKTVHVRKFLRRLSNFISS